MGTDKQGCGSQGGCLTVRILKNSPRRKVRGVFLCRGFLSGDRQAVPDRDLSGRIVAKVNPALQPHIPPEPDVAVNRQALAVQQGWGSLRKPAFEVGQGAVKSGIEMYNRGIGRPLGIRDKEFFLRGAAGSRLEGQRGHVSTSDK